MASWSMRELMACVIARDLRDGDQLQVGIALPVFELAVRLAHLMHGPNMELIFFGARMNVHHVEQLPLPAFGWDRRVVRWSESYSDRGHRFDRLAAWGRRVFCIGGIQVDAFGNTNLIGIGDDPKRLRFRGPGSVGTPTLSSHVGRYYIVLNEHTPRTLVERCDYVSTVGWGEGGADARERLGLPGGGPRWCVTPLGVFGFDDATRRMRALTLHPGISADEVRGRTGFDPGPFDDVGETEPPRAEELDILRRRIDPDGRLRTDPA